MNRYFFHVMCARGMYMDENGQDFSDLKGAKTYAATIAAELAREGSYVGCSVCIANVQARQNCLLSQDHVQRIQPSMSFAATLFARS